MGLYVLSKQLEIAQDDLKTSDLKKIFMDQSPQDKILKVKHMNTPLKGIDDLDADEFMLEHTVTTL